MNSPSHSNVIIGSKIALAMAIARGSPVRAQFANQEERTRTAVAGMARQCESIKKRSRQLLDEIKTQHAALTAASASTKGSHTKDGTEIMAGVVARMLEQQVVVHSNMEKTLDGMMQLIRDGRKSA